MRWSSSFARVIATCKSRRSSSISSVVPVPISEGMQPSTTLRICTAFHSCPFAEWIVEKDQIIIVAPSDACLVTRRLGRIQSYLREKLLSRSVDRGDLLQLEEVALPQKSVVVDSMQMRFIPSRYDLQVGGPNCRLPQRAKDSEERGPICGRRAGGNESLQTESGFCAS